MMELTLQKMFKCIELVKIKYNRDLISSSWQWTALIKNKMKITGRRNGPVGLPSKQLALCIHHI